MKNDMTKTKDITEQYPVIYMIADEAIIEADKLHDKIYYPGISMNADVELLNEIMIIKSILNTIKLESRRSYNGKRDKN